jgi:hypothetical protein
MAEISYRDDLQPLCVVHLTQMRRQAGGYSFFCSDSRCSINWRRDVGYFYLKDGNLTFPKDMTDWLRPAVQVEHGYLYLSAIRDDIKIWQCSVKDCPNILTNP